jgi:leucyl aminopeptidase
MPPEIRIISDISPACSVVYITETGFFPVDIPLSQPELDYAKTRFAEKDDVIHINSYHRSTIIVRAKTDLPQYRMMEELRVAACAVGDIVRKAAIQTLCISPFQVRKGSAEAFTEGLILSAYKFSRYKTIDKDLSIGYPATICLHGDAGNYDIVRLKAVTDASYMVRNLINEPVISMNTGNLVKEVVRMGKESGFSTEVLGKNRIEALKMGGLLAVNKGSTEPPAFIIAEWKPKGFINDKPVVLVGKGVTYDTGGMNLKTGTYMEGMKTDMAGAAAVAGTLYAIAATGLPLHVIGLMPVTDNRVSGVPLVPGDIITMHNGTTVEVLNTDAEGRLILADALSYSALYDPMLVISIATLTGSAAITFGNQATAMMGNAQEEMFALLSECGLNVYERVARLPFWHEYGDAMKSDFADLKNIDNSEAGAIKAGKFLERFVTSPFIHLDIAGPGYLKRDDHYRKKEGPGTGMRLLYAFCVELAGSEEKRNK